VPINICYTDGEKGEDYEKDFISVTDLSGEEIQSLIRDAIAMKTAGWGSVYQKKVLALLFEKPSCVPV